MTVKYSVKSFLACHHRSSYNQTGEEPVPRWWKSRCKQFHLFVSHNSVKSDGNKNQGRCLWLICCVLFWFVWITIIPDESRWAACDDLAFTQNCYRRDIRLCLTHCPLRSVTANTLLLLLGVENTEIVLKCQQWWVWNNLQMPWSKNNNTFLSSDWICCVGRHFCW